MEWINIVRKLNDKLAKKAQWARAWRNSARQFRSMFQGASLEWEAERDRYQEARKDNDGWITCYWQAISQRNEARRLAIHFKQKADERGEWMGNRLLSAACENRRRRELEKRISVLEATCREARRWAINYMRRLEEKMAYKATGDDDEQKAA